MKHTIQFAGIKLVTVTNASLAGVIKYQIQSCNSAQEAKAQALSYIKSCGNTNSIQEIH